MIELDEASVLTKGLEDILKLSKCTRHTGDRRSSVGMVPIKPHVRDSIDGSTFRISTRYRPQVYNLDSTLKETSDIVNKSLNITKELGMLFDCSDDMYQFCVSVSGRFYWGINKFTQMINGLVEAINNNSLPIKAICGDSTDVVNWSSVQYSLNESLAACLGSLEDSKRKEMCVILSILDTYIKPLKRGSLFGKKYKNNLLFTTHSHRDLFLDLILKGSILFPIKTKVNRVNGAGMDENGNIVISSSIGNQVIQKNNDGRYEISEASDTSLLYLSEGTIDIFTQIGVPYPCIAHPERGVIGYRTKGMGKNRKKSRLVVIGVDNEYIDYKLSIDNYNSCRYLPTGLIGDITSKTAMEELEVNRDVTSVEDILTTFMSHVSRNARLRESASLSAISR